MNDQKVGHGYLCMPMKAMKLLCAFVILLIPGATSLFAQGLQLDWVNHLVGKSTYVGDMAIDDNGNVYVGGSFRDSCWFNEAGQKHLWVSNGDFDMYLVKMNSDGKVLWHHTFGSTKKDEVAAIALGPKGEVYVTGILVGAADFDPGSKEGLLSGSRYTFALALDWNGDFLWVSNFHGTRLGPGQDLAVDSRGNVLIGGRFSSAFTWGLPDGSTQYIENYGWWDSYVASLDTVGNVQWIRSIGGPQNDDVLAIAINDKDEICVSGSFFEECSIFDGTTTKTIKGEPYFLGYLLKLNSYGQPLWFKRLHGGEGEAWAYDAVFDSDNNLLLTGEYSYIVDFNPGYPGGEHVGIITSGRLFVLKLNGNGEYLWSKSTYGGDFDTGSIASDSKGNVYVSGNWQGTTDFDPSPIEHFEKAKGNRDAFLLKLDPLGSFVWVKVIGGKRSDHGNTVKVDRMGNCFFTGTFSDSTDVDPSRAIKYLNDEPWNQYSFVEKLAVCTEITAIDHVFACDSMERRALVY